jgi:glycosyltransferase involved in cell wall biosynthesis
VEHNLVNSIAIITPAFNQGEYIRRTIESVLSQEVEDLDYVVMDGGSTDKTVEVLRSFGGKIRWKSEPDKGTADAINKGFLASKGEIVAWLNSDDIYYPGALKTVAEFLDAHPDVDVLYGKAHHIDADDRVLEAYPTEPFSWERLVETCIINQPAAFFRRRIIERFGALDTAYPHSVDYELWIRWAKAGVRFQYLPKFLAATRLHPEAKTIAKRVACHKDNNDILRRHLGKVPPRWLFAYAFAVVEERGLSRKQELSFVSALTWEFVRASLRWNHGISKDLFETIRNYVWRKVRNKFSLKAENADEGRI